MRVADERLTRQGYEPEFAGRMTPLLLAMERLVPTPIRDEDALAVIAILAGRELILTGGDTWGGADLSWSLGVCDAAAIVAALSRPSTHARERDADWWERRFVDDRGGDAHLSRQEALAQRMRESGDFRYVEP